jgi:hypothetical protein
LAVFERTHLLKDDLDWLPGWLKAVRWTVAGTVWTGLFGSLAVVLVFSHGHFFFFGKGLTALALGGFYAGDKSARLFLRRRLAKLARGDVDLARLKHEADGELVHVKGRVRARERLSGLLGGEGVYRRVNFNIGDVRLVHEAAVDFALVDGSGELVIVQTADSRLISAEPKPVVLGESAAQPLLALELPPPAQKVVNDLRQRGKPLPAIKAAEVLLREGDEVELVGYKSRVVDSTVVERLERETPLRATLRGGKNLPLLISLSAIGRRPPSPA